MASQCKDCAERILLEKFCDDFDKFEREHVAPQEPYDTGFGSVVHVPSFVSAHNMRKWARRFRAILNTTNVNFHVEPDIYTCLIEAIAKIEVHRILRKDIVILAPEGTLKNLGVFGSDNKFSPLLRYDANTDNTRISRTEFCGALYIEDETITKLVVKSTVSPHREVVVIPGEK